MKISIQDLLSKCDQIHSFLRIWSHLPKKSLMEIFSFCAVLGVSSSILSQVLKSKRIPDDAEILLLEVSSFKSFHS